MDAAHRAVDRRGRECTFSLICTGICFLVCNFICSYMPLIITAFIEEEQPDRRNRLSVGVNRAGIDYCISRYRKTEPKAQFIGQAGIIACLFHIRVDTARKHRYDACYEIECYFLNHNLFFFTSKGYSVGSPTWKSLTQLTRCLASLDPPCNAPSPLGGICMK